MYLSFKFQSDRTTNTEVMQVSLTLQHCLRLRVCFSFCRRACKSEKSLHGRGVWLIGKLLVYLSQFFNTGRRVSYCRARSTVAFVWLLLLLFVSAAKVLSLLLCTFSHLFACALHCLPCPLCLYFPFRSVPFCPILPSILTFFGAVCLRVRLSLTAFNLTISLCHVPRLWLGSRSPSVPSPSPSLHALLPWHHPRLCQIFNFIFSIEFCGSL